MFYTTELLVSSIKRRTLAPSSQTTFLDSDLINLANEEMQISLVPDIMSLREDFFLKKSSTSVIGNLDHYRLPERATGNALKDLFYLDSSNNRKSLPRIDPNDLPVAAFSNMVPQFFLLRGEEVQLVPLPSSTVGTLEFWFWMRPNQLTPTASCAQVTAVNTVSGTTTFTVNTDLTGSLVVGSLVDVLSGKSPFTLWGTDCAITAITSSTIAVAATGVSNEVGTVLPQVGDYVCPAQYANIPMLPQEFHPVLAQMVAARLMEALGDIQKLQAVNAKLAEMRKAAMTLIANRVENEVQKIGNRNGLVWASGVGWPCGFLQG